MWTLKAILGEMALVSNSSQSKHVTRLTTKYLCPGCVELKV